MNITESNTRRSKTHLGKLTNFNDQTVLRIEFESLGAGGGLKDLLPEVHREIGVVAAKIRDTDQDPGLRFELRFGSQGLRVLCVLTVNIGQSIAIRLADSAESESKAFQKVISKLHNEILPETGEAEKWASITPIRRAG